MDRLRIIDLLCRRPSLLGWPINAPPAPTIQKAFPLLSGQIVDLALWDSQNYWLVRVLAGNVTDFAFERAVFEIIASKTAFEAELGTSPGKALVVPVLFIARQVHEPLLDWGFQLGVYVRCVDLDAGLYA